MENASKAIMIAGGVLLAMIVISICMLALFNASENFNSAEQRRQAQQQQEEMVKFAPYVGTTVYGSEVYNCIKRARNTSIDVTVTGYTEKDFIDNIVLPGSSGNRIRTGKFKGEMETDGTGRITKIKFTLEHTP